eukprot:4626640-Lingulodinium_polyedra.AAC.1
MEEHGFCSSEYRWEFCSGSANCFAFGVRLVQHQVVIRWCIATPMDDWPATPSGVWRRPVSD